MIEPQILPAWMRWRVLVAASAVLPLVAVPIAMYILGQSLWWTVAVTALGAVGSGVATLNMWVFRGDELRRAGFRW